MQPFLIVIITVIALAIGAIVGYWYRQQRYQEKMGDLESMRTRLLEEAEKQARDIVLNGKDEALAIRQTVESERSPGKTGTAGAATQQTSKYPR